MIIEIQEKFKHIRYDDKDHTYCNILNGNNLIPTTTYKKKFQNPFDNYHYWLNKKAVENGLTQQEMQAEWDEQKEVGLYRGTRIHDYVESLTWRKRKMWKLDFPNAAKLQRQALQYIDDDTYINIATEIIIGNEEVSGTIDRLVWCPDRQCMGIVDYKSDKAFKE